MARIKPCSLLQPLLQFFAQGMGYRMTAFNQFSMISTQLISHVYQPKRESFNKSEESYTGWSLLTCDEGLVQYKTGDDEGEVKVGEIVLCPPGETFHRKALTIISFHFAVFHLQAFDQKNEAVFPGCGKLKLSNTNRLLVTLERLRNARDAVSAHYAEHLLNDMLYQAIEEQTLKERENKPADPQVLEAVRYINEHAVHNMSIQDAAHYVGLTQSQFTRKFQKEMGVSPIKYLTGLRLQKVCNLLTETDQTLEQIAEQCGFQTAYYLSRVFTKEMNTSPSRYRINHRV
jgi:AraC-like DNA-binding protein